MAVGFKTNYAISAHHHQSCESESRSWRGALDTAITLCDSLSGWWFSLSTLVYSTNKTDRHDLTEILLKVALITITPPITNSHDDKLYI